MNKLNYQIMQKATGKAINIEFVKSVNAKILLEKLQDQLDIEERKFFKLMEATFNHSVTYTMNSEKHLREIIPHIRNHVYGSSTHRRCYSTSVSYSKDSITFTMHQISCYIIPVPFYKKSVQCSKPPGLHGKRTIKDLKVSLVCRRLAKHIMKLIAQIENLRIS